MKRILENKKPLLINVGGLLKPAVSVNPCDCCGEPICPCACSWAGQEKKLVWNGFEIPLIWVLEDCRYGTAGGSTTGNLPGSTIFGEWTDIAPLATWNCGATVFPDFDDGFAPWDFYGNAWNIQITFVCKPDGTRAANLSLELSMKWERVFSDPPVLFNQWTYINENFFMQIPCGSPLPSDLVVSTQQTLYRQLFGNPIPIGGPLCTSNDGVATISLI